MLVRGTWMVELDAGRLTDDQAPVDFWWDQDLACNAFSFPGTVRNLAAGPRFLKKSDCSARTPVVRGVAPIVFCRGKLKLSSP